MSQDIELLTEIRDLLRVIAEPALAERDAALRSKLLQIVGASKKNAVAALLMDGTRSRKAIATEAKTDSGNLSRFVNKLSEAQLIDGDDSHPKLAVSLPPNFFEKAAG